MSVGGLLRFVLPCTNFLIFFVGGDAQEIDILASLYLFLAWLRISEVGGRLAIEKRNHASLTKAEACLSLTSFLVICFVFSLLAKQGAIKPYVLDPAFILLGATSTYNSWMAGILLHRKKIFIYYIQQSLFPILVLYCLIFFGVESILVNVWHAAVATITVSIVMHLYLGNIISLLNMKDEFNFSVSSYLFIVRDNWLVFLANYFSPSLLAEITLLDKTGRAFRDIWSELNRELIIKPSLYKPSYIMTGLLIFSFSSLYWTVIFITDLPTRLDIAVISIMYSSHIMIVLFVVPFLIFISKHSPNKLSLYIVMEMAVVIACLVILLAISRQNMMALVTAQLAGAVYFSSAILIQNNKRNEVPK
jgi:hypothetical protein